MSIRRMFLSACAVARLQCSAYCALRGRMHTVVFHYAINPDIAVIYCTGKLRFQNSLREIVSASDSFPCCWIGYDGYVVCIKECLHHIVRCELFCEFEGVYTHTHTRARAGGHKHTRVLTWLLLVVISQTTARGTKLYRSCGIWQHRL